MSYGLRKNERKERVGNLLAPRERRRVWRLVRRALFTRHVLAEKDEVLFFSLGLELVYVLPTFHERGSLFPRELNLSLSKRVFHSHGAALELACAHLAAVIRLALLARGGAGSIKIRSGRSG